MNGNNFFLFQFFFSLSHAHRDSRDCNFIDGKVIVDVRPIRKLNNNNEQFFTIHFFESMKINWILYDCN